MSEATLSNSAKTAPRVIGRPFAKGISGNPGGRPVGSKSRINADFLRELADHFERAGRDAIERMCAEDPTAYIKVVASLLPKDATITAQPFGATLSDDELMRALGLLERYFEAGAPTLPFADVIEPIALPAPHAER